MLASPSISVLMPVFNAGRYLRRAVESILSQTHQDFEFIIVNDGSIDNSLEILSSYASKDKRVRLISRPNTGYDVALNEMVEVSRGRYLARMDADDIALPLRFEAQLKFLEEHRDCVVVGTQQLMIDGDGDPISQMLLPTRHEDIDSQHIAGSGPAMSHPTTMIRRDALVAAGCYSYEYPAAEDLALWLRMAEQGILANLPETLFHYRLHGKSVGHSNSSSQQRAMRCAVNDARARRGLPLLPDCHSTSPIAAPPEFRWAWWALASGNIRTSRKHAVRAFRKRPFSREAWKLLTCAMRGY